MNSEELKRRTLAFGLQVIEFIEALPTSKSTEVLGRQLLRCATSVGANYRAACRARSVADFVSKINVVEEEADESAYWLTLLLDTNLANRQTALVLLKEADELTAIFTASGRTAKRRSKLNPQSAIRNPQSHAGFTLIELILVAVILSILLAASMPRFQQTARRLRAEQTVFEFVQLLRLSHERAVAEGREIVWVWDDESHRAQLYALTTVDGDTAATARPIEDRFGRSARLVDDASLELEHPDGAGGCPEGVPEQAACIRFFPDGTSEPTTMTVAVGPRSYVVTVNEATSHAVLTTGTAPP